MKKILKALIGMGALVALWAGVSYAYPPGLPNILNWCTLNSGSINVSYEECNGLAYFFTETSGDNWTNHDNWFSTSDLTTWAHPNGYSTGALVVAGGHLTELNLNEGGLSGTITTGLLYLPYLQKLNLANAKINTINLSQNTGLTFLNLVNTNVSGLNITMLTGLKMLYIGTTRLLGLNLTQNINLTGLGINYTPITYFDLSRNTGLQSLELSFNALTGLDVSNMASLVDLTAIYQSGANMKYVNFSGATSIYRLWLTNAGLTGINILPIGGALSILQIDGNHISTISFTGSYSLGYVNLAGNSVSSLDLSRNYYLSSLFLGNGNTGLTYLDLSYSTGLRALDTSGIAITGFKISTTDGYPSDLIVYFSGNAFDVATLSIEQLWFLNHYMPGWGFRGISGGGKVYVIPKDDCPNGDISPTPYDGLCSGMSANSGGTPSITTTGSSVTTGIVSTTGMVATGTVSSGATLAPVIAPAPKTEKDIYQWAFDHHITTLALPKARLHDGILRYEAAKMIVQFAENIMHTRIAHSPLCDVTNFTDYSSFDSEMTENITKICDLGLMGWAVRNEKLLSSFRPFDTLSAEEFGIVIGRYLGETSSTPASSMRVDIMRFLFTQSQ